MTTRRDDGEVPDGVAERAGVCDPEGLVQRLRVGRCVHVVRHGRVLKDSACVAIADNAENIEHADGRRASPDIERGGADAVKQPHSHSKSVSGTRRGASS